VDIIAKVGGALQQMFGEIADSADEESGVINTTAHFTQISVYGMTFGG
jgi:hypothetical protein